MIFRGSQVALVAAFILFLVAGGTVGYAWIEGWSWADSFYMTVITITAVGYHEVHPLSDTGRIFTVFMLAGGLTNRAIAHELGITQHTVKYHVNAIMSKLAAQSRTEAVVRATQLGLIVL